MKEGGTTVGKRTVGKPPKYKTPEEMQERIDAYFKSCEGEYRTAPSGELLLDRRGKPTRTGDAPLTMAGLQNALGFKSHRSFTDYANKKAFRLVIMKARLRVEQYAEERLFDQDGYSGAAFVLQYGFGWNKEKAGNTVSMVSVNITTSKENTHEVSYRKTRTDNP